MRARNTPDIAKWVNANNPTAAKRLKNSLADCIPLSSFIGHPTSGTRPIIVRRAVLTAHFRSHTVISFSAIPHAYMQPVSFATARRCKIRVIFHRFQPDRRRFQPNRRSAIWAIMRLVCFPRRAARGRKSAGILENSRNALSAADAHGFKSETTAATDKFPGEVGENAPAGRTNRMAQ